LAQTTGSNNDDDDSTPQPTELQSVSPPPTEKRPEIELRFNPSASYKEDFIMLQYAWTHTFSSLPFPIKQGNYV